MGLRRQAVTGDLLSGVTQKFGLLWQVNEHRLLHLVCAGDVLAQLWALGHTLALLSSLYPLGGLVARGTPLCWLSTCKAGVQLLCDHSSAAARSLCTCWTQNFSGCSLFCASLNASIQWVLPCTLWLTSCFVARKHLYCQHTQKCETIWMSLMGVRHRVSCIVTHTHFWRPLL